MKEPTHHKWWLANFTYCNDAPLDGEHPSPSNVASQAGQPTVVVPDGASERWTATMMGWGVPEPWLLLVDCYETTTTSTPYNCHHITTFTLVHVSSPQTLKLTQALETLTLAHLPSFVRFSFFDLTTKS